MSSNQPINQSTSRPRSYTSHIAQSVDALSARIDAVFTQTSYVLADESINQPTNQSTDPSINQPINTMSNQMIGRLVDSIEAFSAVNDQLVSYLIDVDTYLSLEHQQPHQSTVPIVLPINNQSINQSAYNQSASQSANNLSSSNNSVTQSNNQSNHQSNTQSSQSNGQSTNQSINQSILQPHHAILMKQQYERIEQIRAKYRLVCQVSQPFFIQSTSQSINQSIDTNVSSHASGQSINQSINRSTPSPLTQSNPSPKLEIKVDEPAVVDQSINQSMDKSIDQSTNQSTDQSTSDSLNQPVNQSINQSIDAPQSAQRTDSDQSSLRSIGSPLIDLPQFRSQLTPSPSPVPDIEMEIIE